MNYILSILGHWIFSVVGLIYIYTKREENEDNLGWKVIGFYLLGSFSLNFNTQSVSIILPAGFCFYYFIMRNRPRLNKITKKRVAIFGVIMLYAGVLSGVIYEKIENRNHSIITNNNSIDYIKKDWNTIKDSLNIDYSEMKDFNLGYKKDGSIENLYYSVLGNDKQYHITFYPEGGKYDVYADKIRNENEMDMFDDDRVNLNTDQFMDIIENTKFEKYEEADSYTIKYSNHIYTDTLEDKKIYEINYDDYSTKELISKNNIYKYSPIVYVPMKKVSEGSSDSISVDQYLVYYNYSEEEHNDIAMYEGKEIIIKDIKKDISKVITDSYDVGAIIKNMKDSNWVEVKDINVSLEPDLFIKDNEGNVIGLCENESFARRDLDGISVWYIVPSDLYNDIKSFLY
ncbi:hypothetical protein [Clostridium sp. CCUG 7971]|uniref:hypothetical protein n=1 Tax=Clostridium sp. CCUG 7971 TaxID=2811414 RepID=UPI001ABAB66E|nr:hypothetical protein [Clostridium sp. CCUG 7971]MBO3445039.1 hypothetical protein [Clostridium sp. CCUG 7971]